MKIRLLHTILLLSTYLTAQNNAYSWRNYTTNDGLPSPEVYTVIQDSKGYLWFGTDNGVSRFDGYSFQNFGAKEGLADNVINNIQEDEAGRIWFGSLWGKLYYFEKEKMYPFKFNAIIESYQKSFHLCNAFTRFEKGRNTEGGVLLAFAGLGILKITDDGQSTLISANQAPAVLSFSAGKKKVAISQTRLNGKTMPFDSLRQISLFFYDGEKLIPQKTISFPPLSNPFILYPQLRTVGKTDFLLGSKGIFRLNANKQTTYSLYKHPIYDMFTDEDGSIWTAEGNSGGVKIYPNADAVGTDNAQNLLPGISAVTILRDRDGSYWVTSLEKGVFYLRDKRVQIFDKQNLHFPSENITAIAAADNTKVFIGFRDGSVGIFDKAKGSYQKIDSLPTGLLYALKWDAQRQKLYYGGGAFTRTWQDGQIPKEIGFGIKQIALRRNQDAAWLLTHNGLRELAGSEIRASLIQNATVGNRVFSIFEDSQNHLWVGKLDGLFQRQGDSLVAIPNLTDVLKVRIEGIAELPNGNMVFATKGNGLVIYEGKTVIQISKKDGLLTDMLENVVTDAKGNIWVGALAGLHKIYKKTDGTWQVQPITIFQGLLTNEINDIAPNTEGAFLATPKGLIFYRDTLINNVSRPPFLSAFNTAKQSVDVSKPIELSANDNDVALTWQLVNVAMFGKIPYRYRLNAKADWRLTQNRTLELAALSAGKYVFEVQAQNETSVWSDALIVPFVIHPHWYNTLWFKGLVALMAVGMGYFFYDNRLKQIKNEHAIALKINDLERTALAAQMNPHFIFNCLNSIQLLIHKGDKDNAMRYLSHFAKLVRSTLESTRQGKISVEEEAQALEHYLSLEKLRFKEGLTYTIDIDPKIDTFDTELPAMLVQPFVENALKHGLSTAQVAAHISIDFKQKTPNILVVDVKDNGKGLDKKGENNASNAVKMLQNNVSLLSFRRNTEGAYEDINGEIKKTGVGIALARKRLILLNGRENTDDLVIESIVNDKGESVGTHVRLVILRSISSRQL
jgi:ligand-binding sensor domain-containing protein